MELDPRIILQSDILTESVSDIERAKQFIGGMGYFADDITAFADLEGCVCGKLENCTAYLGDHPYVWNCGGRYDTFAFFIPAGALRPVKKHRPYTPEEFCANFSLILGQKIHFRKKDDEESKQDLILQGLWYGQRDGKAIIYARIGSHLYALDELFNEFEWRNLYSGVFQPFGVEE